MSHLRTVDIPAEPPSLLLIIPWSYSTVQLKLFFPSSISDLVQIHLGLAASPQPHPMCTSVVLDLLVDVGGGGHRGIGMRGGRTEALA